MGNTGTALVLVSTVVIIALLVMYGFIDIPFLDTQEPNQWRIDISAASEGGIVTNLQALASINPRGTVFVDPNVPLQVNASDFAGWTFSYWLFDNATYGEIPYVVVPAQAPNSTHTLVAVFEPKISAFQITPDKTFTKGSVIPSMYLVFTNNEAASITGVRLKLNDPYGVFSAFTIEDNYVSSYGNVLNMYLTNFVEFYNPDSLVRTTTINANSALYIAIVGGSTRYSVVSDTIASGVYNLTWEIQFTVSSGSFSEPPELTIPWQVTIIG